MKIPKYSRNIKPLLQLSGRDAELDDWLTDAESAITFLQQNLSADRVVIYASLPHVLIHAVLAPRRQLNESNIEHLDNCFVQTGESWLIEHAYVGGRGDRIYLTAPFNHDPVLQGGEKLVSRRTWEGADSVTTELSQKLVHALDLHYVEPRNAYCRLDLLGDIEEVIRVVDIPSKRAGEAVTAVTIKAEDLYAYAFLARMGLVVFFNFTRFRRGNFWGWKDLRKYESKSTYISYTGGVDPGVGSFVKGWQVTFPPVTGAQIKKRYRERIDPDHKRYTKFIAFDIRSDNVVETSCDPTLLSNYFQKDSQLPLQMSPAFFRSEVLHKYKADPDKYDLSDRSLSCRGTWHLTTYDVNEANQVHTYLQYLSDLPYQEQLYWRSFNESPKAPISPRAYRTDFQGEFPLQYDPLPAIKAKIEHLDDQSPAWWVHRGEALPQVVHYPVTTSQSEWADAILALDQLVVEGFRATELRRIAISLGATPDKEWQSIKLLEVCLQGVGFSAQEAKEAIQPLRDLHRLRSVIKGHATKAGKTDAANDAIRTHSTFHAHFESLAAACDRALQTVVATLDATV